MGIVEIVKEYGINNVRIFAEMQELQYIGLFPGIAFKSNSSPSTLQECKISEERYKIQCNYKITLTAEDPVYGKEHYYISDLEQLLVNHPDKFRIYILTIDGYQKINFTG